MNGKHLILILVHLFRKKGKSVALEEAVHFLSFQCRYGTPTNVRKMLRIALENEMISLEDNNLTAQFLFDNQVLSPNQPNNLADSVIVTKGLHPLY